MEYDVIIIGAGLGGLECGYILAKNGMSVCILEQNPILGGCLQTFKRRGTTFDTGFHYVGGLEEGQHLNRLFHYFGLMDLPWEKLDEEAFDEIIFHGESFYFANGYNRFVETLSKRFPDQHANLQNYVDTLKDIGDNIFNSLIEREPENFYSSQAFTKTAFEFLKETISSPLLRNVLAGSSLKMELHSELPLYIFAQINDSFIRSAWRINGGGLQIADKLAENIRNFGGEVITQAQVDELIEEDGQIKHAHLLNGECYTAKHFISNLHPVATLHLTRNCKSIRNVYRRRINNLPNTFGMFTANLKLKEDSIPYLNRNQFIYETDDLWHYGEYNPLRPTDALLVSYQTPYNGNTSTCNIDLLTPMTWEEVQKWEGTRLMKRGTDYENMKEAKAKEMIEMAGKQILGLSKAIEHIYTSTPLTYNSYTGTYHGGAYGIKKCREQLSYTMLTPKTPIPNLLMTGQNLNLHGVLGVSMTSFFTCAELLGMQKIREELNL